MSYPLVVLERVKKVAHEQEVSFIDFVPDFKAVLSAANRIDYFLPDGHCTEKGYRIMAEKMAAVILQEL